MEFFAVNLSCYILFLVYHAYNKYDLARTSLMLNSYRQRDDVKADDAISPRKVQKADRERLRRDKLNEQFQELGNIVGKIMHLCCIHGCKYFEFYIKPCLVLAYP